MVIVPVVMGQHSTQEQALPPRRCCQCLLDQEAALLELLMLLLQPGVVGAQVEPVHGGVLHRPTPIAR
eukprot:4395500-Lingulodinium_polyedra.AAC.1